MSTSHTNSQFDAVGGFSVNGTAVVDSSRNVTAASLTSGSIALNTTALVSGSTTATITAHAGGGQTSAVALVSEVNVVATVATAGDSVKLPVSAAGLTIVIVNLAAKPIQVFGAGTDTINAVATATGVPQLGNSVGTYVCNATGLWSCETVSGGIDASGILPTVSVSNALTAHAGGGQSGLLLTSVINRVTTVASAADSVLLPVTTNPGLSITVTNAAATNAMNVYPQSGDAINALSVNGAFSVVAGKTATFTCAVAGQWHSVLTA